MGILVPDLEKSEHRACNLNPELGVPPLAQCTYYCKGNDMSDEEVTF